MISIITEHIGIIKRLKETNTYKLYLSLKPILPIFSKILNDAKIIFAAEMDSPNAYIQGKKNEKIIITDTTILIILNIAYLVFIIIPAKRY